uniref:Capsid protein n=1 Tax=Red panda feces-associated genomovirus TaxID=2863991 RepID=A0A8K1M4L8_9VIRU|nr:capsid protein [Red panda feces-associated genomovirus]
MALVTSRSYPSRSMMGYPGFSRNAARVVGYGARMAGKAIGRYVGKRTQSQQGGSRKRQKTGGSAPSAITTYQKDVRQTYRYRRAPRRLRRKWKAQKRRFTSNLLRTLASKKYHYSGNLSLTTGAGTQNFFGFFTYGMQGTGGIDGSGDLEDLRQRLSTGIIKQPNVASDVTYDTRYFFDTMKGRCNLTNGGTASVFIEIYTMKCKRDVPIDFGTSLRTFISQFRQASRNALATNAANTTQQTSASATPTETTVGVTPFQFRWLCQRFKVTDSKRFQISPGNSISFDFTDTKNRCFIPDFQDQNLLCKQGWTTLYLMRQWGANTNGSEAPSTVYLELEKDYNVKVMAAQTPELNYVTYTNTTE